MLQLDPVPSLPGSLCALRQADTPHAAFAGREPWQNLSAPSVLGISPPGRTRAAGVGGKKEVLVRL